MHLLSEEEPKMMEASASGVDRERGCGYIRREYERAEKERNKRSNETVGPRTSLHVSVVNPGSSHSVSQRVLVLN